MLRSHHTALFSLTALAFALTGCANVATKTLVPSTAPLEVSAELTSQSPVNVNNGSRYQRFVIDLQADQVVVVKQQNELAAELSLLDEQNRLIHGPQASSLTLSPPSSGRYQLYFSGANDASYGPFSLQLHTLDVRNHGPVQSGERLAGLLNQSGCNCYDFTVTEGAIYTIALTSDQLDTHLKLTGTGLSVENDDGGDGTNSRIDAYLAPGQYRLIASALDEKPNGTYVLSITERPIPKDLTLTTGGALEAGSRITGLASATPLTYKLRLAQPAFVSLTMSASEVDSYLSLKGQGFELEDDDGAGHGNDAHIAHLLTAGSYELKASSIDKKAGLFHLDYQLTPLNPGRLSSLTPGQYAQGSLTRNGPAYATLNISQAGHYQIDLVSSAFDALLRLEGFEVDAEDDDSAGGRNARLTLDLEPGEYRLHIQGVERESRGGFVISSQRIN